tara:strand:+ start:203 stop:409 length:207 start_codon:yes stop_codon:yes gene_type:complete
LVLTEWQGYESHASKGLNDATSYCHNVAGQAMPTATDNAGEHENYWNFGKDAFGKKKLPKMFRLETRF